MRGVQYRGGQLINTKVIAFDLFGTVFDMKDVPREEVLAYLKDVTQPGWAPLILPKSWEHLPAFPDAMEGLTRLRRKHTVVTLSNAPAMLQAQLLENSNGATFDDLFSLERYRVYKPNPRAYMAACVNYEVDPADFLMVTANPTFAHFDYGDIEMARALGMQAQLIRQPGCPQTIIELAERLGC
jgi:FMN phosphatase YigB (HAD superfamily)